MAPAGPEGPLLVQRLVEQLQRQWHGREFSKEPEGGILGRRNARQPVPDEIELVLSCLDPDAIGHLQRSFNGQALGLLDFLQAVVQTGAYTPDRTLPFFAGTVDLFFEVIRSRMPSNPQAAHRAEISWGDFMNHLLERPEMTMWEATSSCKTMKMHLSSFVDGAKHAGPETVEGICWMPDADAVATTNGGSSVCLRPAPSRKPGPMRELTPELPPDFVGISSGTEFKVLAIGWGGRQDLIALLSNRMLVQWRLSPFDGNFRQVRALQARAGERASPRASGGGSTAGAESGEPKRAAVYLAPLRTRSAVDGASWLRELRTDRAAAREAAQVAVWWSSAARLWVTTNHQGRLLLWDLKTLDEIIDSSELPHRLDPVHVLTAHTEIVTCFTELSGTCFSTCSMDGTIIIWGNSWGSYAPETTVRGHDTGVLSQAYLPCVSSLVSTGRDRLIWVWSLSNSTCCACMKKLKGHDAVLVQVAAGERVFFSLDEAAKVLLWDATSLLCLQTLDCGSREPGLLLCLPQKGRLCVAGRRLRYVDANETLALAMGAKPSLKQQADTQRLMDTVKLRRSGAPRWCSISETSGCLLSATEYEVRFHPRSDPAQSHVVFVVPEGEVITLFRASGRLSTAVCCTSDGHLYLLKYRSGYVMTVHKTRSFNLEEAFANGGGARGLPPAEVHPDRERPRAPQSGGPEASALDGNIRCVIICEKIFRIYVGLSEGQVLVVACDPGFPVVKRLASAKDPSAVTCLQHCEAAGLLVAGTSNGIVHLYLLDHYRLAGSLNIPLHQRSGPGRGSPLQTVHLFDVPATPGLPLSLLTVSDCSRLQLWGLRVNLLEGKLAEVHLVRDLHQLRAAHPLEGSKASEGRRGEDGIWQCGHRLLGETEEEPPPPGVVRLGAFAVVDGPMALPADGPAESPGRPADPEGEEGEDSSGRAYAEPAVRERLLAWPQTPPAGRRRPVEVDGSRFPFVADKSGWIWCVDIKGSIAASLELSESLPIPLKPIRKHNLFRRSALRHTTRGSMFRQLEFMNTTGTLGTDIGGSTLSLPDSEDERKPPFALRTPLAWRAHSCGVAMLTAVGPLPTIVSVGDNREVKVWSAQGDLWGHFSLTAVDGQPPPTVWPPPQVLASQVALVDIAQRFVSKSGLLYTVSLAHAGGRKWKKRATHQVLEARTNMADLPAFPSTPEGGSRSRSKVQRVSEDFEARTTGAPAPASSPKFARNFLPPASGPEEEEEGASPRFRKRRAARSRASSEALGPKDEALELESPTSRSPSSTMLHEEAAVSSPGWAASMGSEAVVAEDRGEDDPSSEDLPADSQVEDSPSRSRCPGFSSEQMELMVQSHAFSKGCRSFKEFQSHTEARWKARRQPTGAQEQALRSRFRDRPTSGLGLDLGRQGYQTVAEGRKGLRRKCASESALLRYVQGSVAELRRTVQEDMGVDVQNLTRREIQRPSFIRRLDVAGVSPDPADPSSVTSQVAKQLSRPARRSRRVPSILANTGQESVIGRGSRTAQASPLRGRASALP